MSAPKLLLGPPKQSNTTTNTATKPPMGRTENSSATYLSSGNPCLDLFFHIVPDPLLLHQRTTPKVMGSQRPNYPQAHLQPPWRPRQRGVRQRSLLQGSFLAPQQPSKNPSLQPRLFRLFRVLQRPPRDSLPPYGRPGHKKEPQGRVVHEKENLWPP
ncbi:hypothetical protein ACLB2K_052511 [Fragaria x ananassa]